MDIRLLRNIIAGAAGALLLLSLTGIVFPAIVSSNTLPLPVILFLVVTLFTMVICIILMGIKLFSEPKRRKRKK